MVKNDSLITYEKAISGQAVIKKFFITTFLERKIMSTKTSFKRIALVAASALAIGGFSAVSPAHAAIATMDGVTKTSSSSYATASFGNLSVVNGATAFTVSAALAQTDIGKALYTPLNGHIGTIATLAADGLSGTFSAATTCVTLVAAAAHLGSLPTTTVATGIVSGQISGMTATAGRSVALNIKTTGTPDAGEKFRAKYVSTGAVAGTSVATTAVATELNHLVVFTAPATVGTYPMVIEHSLAGTFLTSYPNADRPFADYAFTLTVTAASDLSTDLSTAYATTPTAGGATASTTTNAVKRSAPRAANTGILQIKVTLLKADGTADTQAHVVTATATGVGFVQADTTPDVAPAATTRTETDNAGASVRYVHVNSDGTAGTGTVKVTVQNVNTLVTTTLGTWDYTSTGSVAAIAVDVSNFKIGLAGGSQAGRAIAARNLAGEVTNAGALNAATTTPAFTVTTKDSSGNLASASAVPAIVPASTTIVSSGTCVLDDGSDTTYSSGAGIGVYNCAFTTSASAKSGDKTTLTVRIVDPADATKYLTTTYDVTIGGSVSTEALAFDKSTYATGESIVVTMTAKDSAGNPVADGSASPAVTFNKSVGGTYGASLYKAGARANKANTLFAPASTGDLVAFATSGNAAATALTATSTVGENETAALALDAANAATDAANNAYDEAQNATQAASDALAAVTALAAQVKTLIASVKALTAAVAKLKKK